MQFWKGHLFSSSIKMTSKGGSSRMEVSTMKCINYSLLPQKSLKEPLIMKFVGLCVILSTREDTLKINTSL